MLKGGVSADEFLRSSGLAKILEDIMVGCCREKPDKLAPYVVDYLNGNYSKSAKQSVAKRSGVDAGNWKPRKDFVPTNPLLMEQYLEDLRIRPLMQRITEKAVLLRPSNVVALAVDVTCGTDSHLMDADEERAAKSLQSRQRGNAVRKERKQQQQAATRVQATQRGKNARKNKRKPAGPPISEEGAVSMGD